MKDFLRVFVLFLAAMIFYGGLFLLRVSVNPFLLSFIGIFVAVSVIVYFIYRK
ncbi:MAG: hypothetical protein ACJ75J_00705 [Cytophagaceae bacterium]